MLIKKHYDREPNGRFAKKPIRTLAFNRLAWFFAGMIFMLFCQTAAVMIARGMQ